MGERNRILKKKFGFSLCFALSFYMSHEIISTDRFVKNVGNKKAYYHGCDNRQFRSVYLLKTIPAHI